MRFARTAGQDAGQSLAVPLAAADRSRAFHHAAVKATPRQGFGAARGRFAIRALVMLHGTRMSIESRQNYAV